MKKNLIIFIIFFSFFKVSAQNEKMNKLAKQLSVLSNRSVSETVYLKTSKGIYETKEDLWFKGTVVNSYSLIPSIASKTLFVRLIGEEDKKVVWQEKYTIENGFVDGHIFIQDTLEVGNYRIEAFTPNSIYKDRQEFKAFRKIKIIKRISTYKAKNSLTVKERNTKKSDSLHFNFFPEGGFLVNNIETKVGFKTVDKKGAPRNISGVLYENNKELLTFKSEHLGMGSFKFRPNIKNNYHIKLNDSLIIIKNKFPEIQIKGKALQVLNNSKDTLKIKVSQSLNLEKETIYIRLQIRGVVYTVAKATLEKKVIVKLPLKNLPQGIAEITLFNENLQPLLERLVYIKQNQKLYIKAILDKENYKTKDKVNLKLKVVDQDNKPIKSHLSVSIYDQIYKNEEDTKTIESHFQLSTQLKGNIYNPNYYFNDRNKNRKRFLDLLMLTQGWRAYVWNENNLNQEVEKKYPIINDTIIGKVYTNNSKDRTILSQQYLRVFTADKNNSGYLIKVDSIGRFKILPKHMQQTKTKGYLYMQLLSDLRERSSIIIDDTNFKIINQILKSKNLSYPNFHSIKKKNVKNRLDFYNAYDHVVLDEITIKTKKDFVFRDKYIGKLDSLAKLEISDDVGVCGFLNCPNKSHFSGKKPVEGRRYSVWIDDSYAFRVTDGYYHVFGGDMTKTLEYHYKQLSVAELLKKFNIASVKLNYPKKLFYEPVYDNEQQNNFNPDYRNTIFWKSNVITDNNGEANLSFYCSDINTTFLGTIEGISLKGLLGFKNLEFVVRKR